MKIDPNTDTRLTEPERALYTRIYPLIAEIEHELDVSITMLVACNMVRRAISEGHDIDWILTELRANAVHQAEYNTRSEH
mgnify:CR=1 FL=1